MVSGAHTITDSGLGNFKISIFFAFALALLKFAIAFLTGSLVIMASGLDSLLDVGSSLVNWFAMRQSIKPPDADHAYGHGKIESLAALLQSQFIALSAIYMIIEAIRRLVSGSELRYLPLGIGTMVVSLGVSMVIVYVMQQALKKKKALLFETEKLHYATDILTNGGAILALLLSVWTRSAVWDLLISLVLVGYILITAARIFKESADELTDRSLPRSAIHDMKKIILNYHPAVTGIHQFRTRKVGERIFVDFHVEITGEKNFENAHSLTEEIIKAIQKEYPKADVTAHCDPEDDRPWK
ncbi:MAG: cation diffusion facilitator family transporter [Candidatus Omnitrophota bacterium]